jgi:hypothetical protein
MQNLRTVLGKLVNGNFASGIVVGIVGAAATVWLTSSAEERQEVRRAKMEVLRKIAANRCALSDSNPITEMRIPMAEALNEAFVVFNGSPHVVAALANFRLAAAKSSAAGQGAEPQANKTVYLLDAIRAMSSDVGVKISDQREIEQTICIGR